MIRSPAVAGTFYPVDPTELNNEIETFIKSAKDFKLEDLKGVITPHAGYIYSGPIAGTAYRQLENLTEREYKVFLIGPSHHAYISASVGNFAVYQTPLGEVPVDQKICAELLKQDGFEFTEEAHISEHCLEVQLPFLQNVLKNFQIIPVLCGSIDPKILAETLKPYFGKPDTLFIVSSDLSHYLPYNEARVKDQQSLNIITNLNLVEEEKIDACGATPIKTAMRLSSKIQLLDYRNSGDTAGDKSSVVGYAALAIT